MHVPFMRDTDCKAPNQRRAKVYTSSEVQDAEREAD